MKFESYKQFVESRPKEIEPVLVFIHKDECEKIFCSLNELEWPDRFDFSVLVESTKMDKRELASKIKYVGYERLINPNTKDGRWKIDGRNTTVYSKGNSDYFP